ncbi:MAG: polysaccharide biosynthesis/export family protein [Caulobacteraceae bacterium]
MLKCSIRSATAGAVAAALLAWAAQAGPIVPVSSLPAADSAAFAIGQDEDYRIGAYDTLDISVFQVDLLSRTVQVDASGHIQFPMIGDLTVAGKTTRQVADEIAAKLDQNYVRSPQVTVVLKDSASQKFTVEGAVKGSGVFPLQGHMTLLKAIAVAQGVDIETAKQKDVVIFRTVDHKRVAGVVDLGAVGKGKIDDPPIYAGDVIVVPTSASRRFMKDLIAATPILFFLHP